MYLVLVTTSKPDICCSIVNIPAQPATRLITMVWISAETILLVHLHVNFHIVSPVRIPFAFYHDLSKIANPNFGMLFRSPCICSFQFHIKHRYTSGKVYERGICNE